MEKFLQVIWLAWVLPLSLLGQPGSTPLVEETTDYQIEEFVPPGGTLGNNVNCIVQGPNGFLWFGSKIGLHRYDGHEFLTYGPEEGDTLQKTRSLTFPNIRHLYWDSFDKLWVSTYGGGIYCFDPKTEHFENFIQDTNHPTFNNIDYVNYVKSAVEDTTGNMWFGVGGGLLHFDRKTKQFKRYIANPGKPGSLVQLNASNVYVDKEGTLWISCGLYVYHKNLGGLSRYDPNSDSFVNYMHSSEDSTSLWANPVGRLLEDRRGNFWVATAAGLQKMDRETGEFERMYPSPNLPYAPGTNDEQPPVAFSLLEDSKGGIWVGTLSANKNSSHLLRYDPETSKVTTFPIPFPCWHIVESLDGTIWVSGGFVSSKVFRIIPKQEKQYDFQRGIHILADFKKTNLYQKLGNAHPQDTLYGPLSMTFDNKDETIWLRYVFETRQGETLAHHAILAHHDKNIDTTKFYHLEALDLSGLGSVVYFGNPTPDYASEGLAIGEDGKIWGAYPTENVGIFCFDPKTGETINYLHDPEDSNSLLSNYVVILMMDSRGEIWTGHHQKGLCRFNPATKKWTHYLANAKGANKIGGYFPKALMEGLDGKIWIGGKTVNAKPFITILDPDSNSATEFPLPELGITDIRVFAQKEGTVVFGTNGLGIGIISTSQSMLQANYYNLNEGTFPVIWAGSTFFDETGKLWVSSHNEALISCMDVENETWFTVNNKTNEPTQSRKGYLGSDGHIYLPNINKGWEEINPADFSNPDFSSAQVALTNFYVKGERQIPGRKASFLTKPIGEMEELNLSYNALPFGFRFSGFDFQSSNINYQYRLFPFETDWKTAQVNPEVDYSNVSFGNYQFQVKAYAVNGLIGSDEIHITIHPPWWKTWWAYTFFAFAFILLLSGIYQYQRRRWQMQARLQLEQEKAAQLKELDFFKSRFYTNITHEFRTPITVIKGMSDQVQDEKVRTIIQRNSDRLLNMVNQLLDLSKLETNNLSINWIQGDIIPFLQYLTESCHSLAENKNLNLAFFSKVDSLVMDFDETKMQHILINLLANAIKFTPEYGSVKVISDQITENGSTYLNLEVKDTGKGIPQEKLPHIFDRFYQVDNSATRQGEGAGIGLALVHELVQLLKGRIEVESQLDKGTSFSVYLPVQLNASAKTMESVLPIKASRLIDGATISSQPILTTTKNNGEKPLVLIVEDNADVASYIVSCLEKDYSLQTARNGKEGIEKALESIPDLIICDVMMPEMDGFEVCQRLKTDRLTSHIPIILLTAKATQEDKVIGLSHGADAYLTKPFDKKELLVRLSNLAAQSKLLRERLATPQIKPSASEKREAAFLNKLHKIIESNMADEFFETHRLCKEIAMSRSQLHRKLKALTGQSTAKYIRSIRLQKAKYLLENSDLPIGEIVSRVGFKDFSHFSRTYTKVFGVNPSETRN